jgi:hypothetical protein
MSSMKMRSILLGVALAACGSKKPATTEPTGGGSGGETTGGATTLAPKDVEGYWTGDWGQLVFREKDGKMLAAYNHDDGTIVGTIQGDTLVGWWCEVPSRKPDSDAGDVEMKFITNAEGKRAIDGRWRYGSKGDFREDWDITWDAGQPSEALVTRFDDPAAFCAKP